MTLIPEGAIVIYSSHNDEPLMWRYRQDAAYSAPIEVVNDNMIQFEGIEVQFAVPVYVGAILSANRQTIYWVNNTQPLP